jgi:hypothetical protein
MCSTACYGYIGLCFWYRIFQTGWSHCGITQGNKRLHFLGVGRLADSIGLLVVGLLWAPNWQCNVCAGTTFRVSDTILIADPTTGHRLASTSTRFFNHSYLRTLQCNQHSCQQVHTSVRTTSSSASCVPQQIQTCEAEETIPEKHEA